MAYRHESWESSLHAYTKAMHIFRNVLSSDVQNISYRQDLANALGRTGRCYRHLDRLDEALQCYMELYEIRRQLAESHPNVLRYAINLAQAEHNLAVWHMTRRAEGDSQEAYRWLTVAGDRLREWMDSGQAAAQHWDVTELLAAVEKNLDIIQRRRSTEENITAATHSGS